jgi:predicted RNA-binding protein YlqC (UPF0109 family)
MARSLVDHPDSVRVSEVESSSGTVLELTVADSDMGRVIGKGGRVVNAMRTMVDVAAEKSGQRVSLEIVD